MAGPSADLGFCFVGGYVIEYENNNVKADDVVFDTRLTRLTMLMAYPGINSTDFKEVRYIQG